MYFGLEEGLGRCFYAFLHKVSRTPKNGTAMSEKLEILQCLIENRIFASSPSALAQELGYKGKMTLYRIIKEEVAEKTVNDVWEKLKAVYYLEDEDLFRIANICYTAKEF